MPRLQVNIVTLGVADMVRARAFYRSMGLEASAASQDSVTFFEAGGTVLGLFDRAALAKDAHVDDHPTGFAAVALAWNLDSEAEVDAAIAQAARSGARVLKSPRKVFWGGYSGYFADLDGHIWEVAYNPFFPRDPDGRLQLPPPAASSDKGTAG